MLRIVSMVGMLAVAAPASAQITDRGWTPGRTAPPIAGNVHVDHAQSALDLRDLRQDISRGRDSGALTRRQARDFRRQAGFIGSLSRRYGRDGTTESERRELDLATRVLAERIGLQRLEGANRR